MFERYTGEHAAIMTLGRIIAACNIESEHKDPYFTFVKPILLDIDTLSLIKKSIAEKPVSVPDNQPIKYSDENIDDDFEEIAEEDNDNVALNIEESSSSSVPLAVQDAQLSMLNLTRSAAFIFIDNRVDERKIAYFTPCLDQDRDANVLTSLQATLLALQKFSQELKDCSEWIIPFGENKGSDDHWITLHVKRVDNNIKINIYDSRPWIAVVGKRVIETAAYLTINDPKIRGSIATIFGVSVDAVQAENQSMGCQFPTNSIDCGPWNVKFQELLFENTAALSKCLGDVNLIKERQLNNFIYRLTLASDRLVLTQALSDFRVNTHDFTEKEFLEEFLNTVQNNPGKNALHPYEYMGKTFSVTNFEYKIINILLDKSIGFLAKLNNIYYEASNHSPYSNGFFAAADTTVELLKQYCQYGAIVLFGQPINELEHSLVAVGDDVFIDIKRPEGQSILESDHTEIDVDGDSFIEISKPPSPRYI